MFENEFLLMVLAKLFWWFGWRFFCTNEWFGWSFWSVINCYSNTRSGLFDFFLVFLLIFFIFFQENLKKFEFEHKDDGEKEKESMHEWEKDAKKWLDEQILHSPSIPPVWTVRGIFGIFWGYFWGIWSGGSYLPLS